MALRFLMVSLVVAMGFEWPSLREAGAWGRSGREWVDARAAELSGLGSEVARAFTNPAGPDRVAEAPNVPEGESSTRDLAFEVVVEGMASTFSADLAASRADRPAPALAIAGPSPALPETEAAPAAPPAFLQLADSGTETEDEESSAPSEAPPVATRGDRLSSAVRLTRQAVSAWASLIEEPASGTDPSR